MLFTWFGTASVKLEIGDEKILFDPFFRMNKRLPKPDLHEFTEVDYIFNTHSHFDHTCDLPKIMPATRAKVYGTAAMKNRLLRQEMDGEQMVVLQHGDSVQTKNARLTACKSQHVKNDLGIVIKTAAWGLARLKFKSAHDVLKLHNDFRMGGQIFAYLVEAENKRILILGSAGMDFDAPLPQNVDYLVWPFQGRSLMTKYSLKIIERINPKNIILDHFDNAFPPITSTIHSRHFKKILKKRHPSINVIVPEFNKPFEI